MTRQTLKNAVTLLMIAAAAFNGEKAEAQCPAIEAALTGLDSPLGIAQTNGGNFVVSESGRRGVLHSGLPLDCQPARAIG